MALTRLPDFSASIPSLVLGGPPFIASRGAGGVHSPSPPIAQLAEEPVARSSYTTAPACESSILVAWRLFSPPAELQRQLSWKRRGHCIGVAVGRNRTAGQENGR